MEKSRITNEQIAFDLKQAESGVPDDRSELHASMQFPLNLVRDFAKAAATQSAQLAAVDATECTPSR